MVIWIVVIIFVLSIFLLGLRNYKRIKKAENVETATEIAVLNDGNFNRNISKGVVLVDFWADWCMPCKVIQPTLNELAIHYADKGVTIAKVEVEKNRKVSTKYNIRALPTLILFKDGKEIERFQGIKSTRYLMKKIESQLT